MNIFDEEREEYEKVKEKYNLKDFKAAIDFVNELKTLNGIKSNYRV